MEGSKPIINSHFITVDSRRMHYRQAGTGLVVVMLHASPNSSKAMAQIQEVFASEFSTIAVDLPGYGLSDPLGVDDLKTEDLADAIVALLDELGIEQAALYGRHTGAGIAVEAANRHPSRVSMVLTDGFPAFDEPYTDERLDEYLGSIDPEWDGSHLLWLWFRCRDLYVFWPWDKRNAAARADTTVPSADSLHRCAVELLEAGNGFRKVYASAFRHAGLRMIHKVQVPVCFGNRPGDSQFHTMGKYPPEAWTQEFPRLAAEAALAERDVLRRHPARSTFAQSSSDFSSGTIPPIGYAAAGERQTLVRASGAGLAGTPTLLLHDMPGSSALHLDLLEVLGESAPAFAIDLLGCGDSRTPDPADVRVPRWSKQIHEFMRDLRLSHINIVALGTSAAAAVEFVGNNADAVGKLVLRSPPTMDAPLREVLSGQYAVSAEPEWDGTHLVRVFHHLRDQQLWWPWFDRTHHTIRRNEPAIDAAELTLRVRGCVKQPAFYSRVWGELLAYPLLERLAALRADVIIADHPADAFERFSHATGRSVVKLGGDEKQGTRTLAELCR